MQNPIPTPFDIIEPSPGAIMPTGLAWLTVILSALLALFTIMVMNRRRHPTSVNATLRQLLDELRQTEIDSTGRVGIERVARLAQRIISPFTPTDITAMSSAEIRALSKAKLNSNSAQNDSLAEVLSLLAELEDHAYAPKDATTNQKNDIQHLVQKLIRAIDSHLGRYQPL